ncbi:MAG: uracil-DNA glycosylase [Chloroflexi bacterium]|nr:uracil-DNA glycosylase [Chloroflexota bacterium]
MTGADRAAARLAELRAENRTCQRCRLWQVRRQTVFGEGDPHARLFLVGEGPGETEDRLGRPFVGRSGALLDRALAAAGIRREAVWVTNVVKSRPALTPGLSPALRERGAALTPGRRSSSGPTGRGAGGEGGQLRNRAPRPDEIAACRIWLDGELDAVRPLVIVCLGAVAASALIGPGFRLTAQRGEWQAGPGGIPTLATFHPAYVLRAWGVEREERMSLLVADLRRARERAEGADRAA